MFEPGKRNTLIALTAQAGLEMSESASITGSISELSTAKSPRETVPTSRPVSIDNWQTAYLIVAHELSRILY